MAWLELTIADVLGVLNEPETLGYQGAAAAAGQDPIVDSIRLVTHQCRGYIGDHSANKLAAGLTLPERCHLPALHMVRVEMLTRLDMEVSKDRESAKRDAIRFFERVSEGKVEIEQPEGATDDSGPVTTIKVLSDNERQATRESLRGL